MKIVIAYLYYDLLNLYGESGNVKMLKFHLKNQKIKTDVKYLTINDKFEFAKYDLVIMGAGTENNQKVVLNHLMQYKNDIRKAIHNNKFFLITGNAIDLFGKCIVDNNEKINCLNIFDYIVLRSNKRIVSDSLFLNKETNEYVVGFQNQSSILINNNNPMFDVIIGKNTNEGIHFRNFYGTYLIGPLLIRNPKFAEMFIRKLILSINPKFVFSEFNLRLETNAYDKYFNLHYAK